MTGKKEKEFIKMETNDLRALGKDEAWLQDAIFQNPEMLGLEEVFVRDKERRQPAGGRVDMLLETTDNEKRYEVEIQLGKTDETHIIRTLEYFDNERKLYPQYEHCAVIVAEEITGRFFNVIGLFNGHIPIIALKLTARPGNPIELLFTKILDRITLGKDDGESESSEAKESDWVGKVGPEQVNFAKTICKELGGSPRYLQQYIAVSSAGRRDAKVRIEPHGKFLRIDYLLPEDEELTGTLKEMSIYEKRGTYRYFLKIANKEQFDENKDMLVDLFNWATGQTSGGGSGDSEKTE